MTNMVRNSVWLGYHPKEKKKTQRILLEKGSKQKFGSMRSYQVICLLNYIGKIVKKVVAE